MKTVVPLAFLLMLVAPAASAQAIHADGRRIHDARECIAVTMVPKRGVDDTHQELVNKCNQQVRVAWCRGPSNLRRNTGMFSTVCGLNGNYYQQFPLLDPGAASGNPQSAPSDAEIRFVACFGRLRHKPSGDFECPGDGGNRTDAQASGARSPAAPPSPGPTARGVDPFKQMEARITAREAQVAQAGSQPLPQAQMPAPQPEPPRPATQPRPAEPARAGRPTAPAPGGTARRGAPAPDTCYLGPAIAISGPGSATEFVHILNIWPVPTAGIGSLNAAGDRYMVSPTNLEKFQSEVVAFAKARSYQLESDPDEKKVLRSAGVQFTPKGVDECYVSRDALERAQENWMRTGNRVGRLLGDVTRP